jgi:hypothetical protein
MMNWPDRRYDSFKTWSGMLERQITHLAGGELRDGDDFTASYRTAATSVPEVDRFYAALEGPELEQLKVLNRFFGTLYRYSISLFSMK